MSKKHAQQRVVENKGIASFYSFCANHKPAITWRPTTNDDIGIDGEVELYDESGSPLAEILKVQLKSTEHDKSYIRNENKNNGTFTFYAEREHVEYWQKLANDVLLVIYDNRDNKNILYAKKIENIDLRNSGVKSVPIKFNAATDILNDNHEFLERFSRVHNPPRPTIKPVAVGEEKLVSNLLRISFPTNKVYLAPLNYDRDDVIRNSWNTDNPISLDASARVVARSALNQKGFNFGTDWTLHNNQIVTFHDINNSKLSLSNIADSPVDELTVEEFYSVNDDYERVFKTLLKLSVQQHLYKAGYEWRKDEELFRVIAPAPLKHGLELKQSWTGDKKAERTVFKAKYYEANQKHYCQHFAFSIDVRRFGEEWFLCINPTWTVSIDGKQKSSVAYKTVKAMKRLERNKSVYNHLRFVVFQLTDSTLFRPAYPFLSFIGLENFETDFVIDEGEWLRTEEKDEIKFLEDLEEQEKSQYENTLF